MENLQGAALIWSRLEIDIETRLNGVDLRGSYLRSQVPLTPSTLHGENLSGMHLEADIGAVTLHDTNVLGIKLKGTISGVSPL